MTVDPNWLPVPGTVVAVTGLVLMAVPLCVRRPWSLGVSAFASGLIVGGVVAMIIGVVLAVQIGGLT